MGHFGFYGTHDEVVDIWRKNALRWPHLTPPWRPSRGDTAIYRKLSGPNLKKKVLLLGATPELRDLIAEAAPSEKPVIVDISRAMLVKASGLLQRANIEDEVWVESDWRDLTFPLGHFDLIMGDMVWWVLSIEEQREVRDNIVKLLRKDGVFVSRFRFKNTEALDTEPLSIIQSHVEKYLRRPSHMQDVRNQMLSLLYDVTADDTHKRICRECVRKVLIQSANLIENPEGKAFVIDASKNIVGADWTVQERKEILGMFKEKFALVEEAHADDYEACYYPILKFAHL